MESTYKVNWNIIKKGSLIKFRNSNNIIYRILTLADDGTAQLMPCSNFNVSSTDTKYMANSTTISQTMPNAARTKSYYIYTKPLCDAQGIYDALYADQPFYSYLEDASINQNCWILNDVPLRYSNTFTCPTGELDIGRKIFYKADIEISNPTIYKWRPLNLDDLIAYLGNQPTLEEFTKFWPRTINGQDIAISSQLMIEYDSGMYNENRSGYLYCDSRDPEDHTLTTKSFLKSEMVYAYFIPVFKVNLMTLLNNNIIFTAVQE